MCLLASGKSWTVAAVLASVPVVLAWVRLFWVGTEQAIAAIAEEEVRHLCRKDPVSWMPLPCPALGGMNLWQQ